MGVRTSLAVAAVAATLAVVTVPLSQRLPSIGCAGPTREALGTVTHLDGAWVQVSPAYDDGNTSVCGGRRETNSDGASVVEHYRGQLVDAGWTVKVLSTEELGRISGCSPEDGGCPTYSVLQSRHDEMCLTAMAETYPGSPTAVQVTAGPCRTLRGYDPNVL